MSHFVIDASVIAKWFFREERSDSALRLLDEEHELSSPDLLLPEVGNAVWKRIRRGEISRDSGQSILAALRNGCVIFHGSGPLMSLALEIASELTFF